jgi:tetratricopeptide (TPR) repeat protein
VPTVRQAPRRVALKWFVPAVLVAIAVVGSVYMFRHRSNAVADARTLLDRYDKAENVDRAIALLEPAVTAQPSDPVRRTMLAEAYWRRYETTRDKPLIGLAAETASASLKLDPNYAQTHVVLAIFNNGQTRYDGAAGEAQQAITLDPKSVGGWRELGRAYLGQGKRDEAGRAFLKAVEFGPDDWPSHNNLGAYYFASNRLDDAAQSFEKVLALAPNNVKAYNNLGSVHLRQERFDRAREMYERSLSIERNATALSNLGRAYYEQGMYPESARTFEDAVAMPGASYQLWANLGAACYFARACARARKWRTKPPSRLRKRRAMSHQEPWRC